MIKKDITKNEYYYADGIWVRDFAKKSVKFMDLNKLIPEQDMNMFLRNELKNSEKTLQSVSTENIKHEKILIVSSGFKFDETQKVLESLPNDVVVIGVNECFVKWDCNRRMNYYVVNNPYPECMRYFPKEPKFLPRVIASIRTYPDFIEKCKGITFTYSPSVDMYYSGLPNNDIYRIDDYRNPICASIVLSYRFGAKKLFLLSCEDLYDKERPGTVKVKNELWAYPQQLTAKNIIDGNLYWLNKAKVSVSYNSEGVEYSNATYIETDSIASFFNEA